MQNDALKSINVPYLIMMIFLKAVLAIVFYAVSKSVWLSVVFFLILIFVVPLTLRARINRHFKQHLLRFGEAYIGPCTKEMDGSAVYGVAPFDGGVMHCAINVDASGLLIGKSMLQVDIPWASVVGFQIYAIGDFLAIDFNMEDFEEENVLSLPWADEFSQFLPEIEGVVEPEISS